MEETTEELKEQFEQLKLKYSELESKYNKEINQLSKNEEELLIKIMFLDGIANSTFDGFLVVNPFGQKVLQNQRTIDLWKIPKEVVDDPDGLKQVHHVMNMTVNPQQFIDEIDYLRDHPNDKSRDELELVDGTILERYSSPVIGADGKNYGRIWTFHDITDRKNFEKQLVQLNKDKDHFISILSHDLRSPFSHLIGFSQLLKKNIGTYTIERTEEIVDLISITIKRTYELLEDTLLWASIQSKKIVYNPTQTNITEIITEVLEILASGAKTKNITIQNNLKNELILFIDIYMLKAILRNLISNAIKFTREGGTIEISVNDTEQETTFEVKDNGVGIKPESIKKLFSVTSIHSTKGTSNELGTGLGLILCKEFIDLHHGKIWIESILNEGTKVSFTIPRKMD